MNSTKNMAGETMMETRDRYGKESVKSKGFKWLLKLTRSRKFWEKSGEDLRKAIEIRRMLSDEPPKKLLKRINIKKGDINGKVYYELQPKQETDNKTIFYVHGGAYVYRISKLHWNFLGKLVDELHCTIIVPLYPLAPEHTHQHTLAFMYTLYRQLMNTMKHPETIILMGDSAGGGLALLLAQLLKEKQLEQPGQMILISPWLDVSLTNPDIAPIEKHDPFLVKTGLKEAGKMFAGTTDTKHPKVSPLYGELNGLAPITMFMGSHDILAADARKFVAIAEEQGVPVHYVEAPKMIHIYPIYNFPESRVALEQMVEKIK
ncbi:alpha/beta hydrolase [Lentibacillus lipolyticus]|nr:alpha/beta hydrolase [Lentibacillus lipolyticus]